MVRRCISAKISWQSRSVPRVPRRLCYVRFMPVEPVKTKEPKSDLQPTTPRGRKKRVVSYRVLVRGEMSGNLVETISQAHAKALALIDPESEDEKLM